MISIIRKNGGGCQYHRQIAPIKHLGKLHGGDHLLTDAIYQLSDEELKSFKVAQFQGIDHNELYPIFRELGLKVWYDIDDVWELETRHPLYYNYKQLNVKGKTEKLLRDSDIVTTPNEKLCELASKFNKNVVLLNNFINPNEPQFFVRPKSFERITFGWIGAKFHVHDVQLLRDSLDKLYNESLDFRVVYGGYMYGDPNSETIQQMLTGGNNKKAVERYGYLKAEDEERYAYMYNHINVALAPLADTRYNTMKSELKIIEAGHFGIPVIASDVYPYNTVVEHGVNGFLVKKERNHKDWLKYMKVFIKNPETAMEMGQELRKTVNEKFNADKITLKRKQILDTL